MQEAYCMPCSKSLAGGGGVGGVPTLTGRYLLWPGGYLPWLGVPTLAMGLLPWLGVLTLARGYLSWPGGTYLGQGKGTYLGLGVPTLAGGYPPWPGGTHLGRGTDLSQGGYPTLVWGTHLGQDGVPPSRDGILPRCGQTENITSHRTTYAGSNNHNMITRSVYAAKARGRNSRMLTPTHKGQCRVCFMGILFFWRRAVPKV